MKVKTMNKIEQGVKVSVIIPAYNVADYITYTIESIIKQTLNEIEIIVIDDGSTDDTLSVVRKLEASDSRIKVVTRPNTGVSGARNDGIKLAVGEYICFVDSDDLIAENMLEQMFSTARATTADMCAASIRAFHDNTAPNLVAELGGVDVRPATQALADLLYENGILNSQCSKLYARKSLAGQEFDKDIAYGEDMLFNYEFMQKAKKIAVMNFNPYFYRQRQGSAMTAQYKAKRADSLFVARRFYEDASRPNSKNHQLRGATMNKLFTESVSILGLMSGADYSNALKSECLSFIVKHRRYILLDLRANKKNKVFAFFAFLNPALPSKLVRLRNALRKRQLN